MTCCFQWKKQSELGVPPLDLPWRVVHLLIAEMDRQGMLKHIEPPENWCRCDGDDYAHYDVCNAVETGSGGIPAFKLEANGWRVTEAEVEGALAVASETPSFPRDDSRANEWEAGMRKAFGGEISFPPLPSDEKWLELWQTWIKFLQVAVTHGGFSNF
jgi:hypothetical protein